jgi:tryptophan synthase alpha chain
MGYFNPMLQYGVENFCKKCAEIGIDGLIIPDLPVDVYADEYKKFLKIRTNKRTLDYTSNFS